MEKCEEIIREDRSREIRADHMQNKRDKEWIHQNWRLILSKLDLNHVKYHVKTTTSHATSHVNILEFGRE